MKEIARFSACGPWVGGEPNRDGDEEEEKERKGTRERDEARKRRRRRKGSSRDPAALPFDIITRLTNFLVS